MPSAPNPFDFSDYSSSQSDADAHWPVGSPSAGSASNPFAAAPPAGTAAGPAFGAPGDPFGAAPARPTGGVLQGRPPMGWLWSAALAALVGVGLTLVALTGGAVLAGVIGWAFAGLVAFGLLAFFTVVDTRQRAMSVYAKSESARVVYCVVAVLAFAGVALGAWSIADWAGRL